MKFATSIFSFLLFLSALSVSAETIVISGNITTSETWTRQNTYVLAPGFHYVIENSTLTIESGTIIKGDEGTLVVTQGSKLIAVGTPTQPIVFTSNKAVGERAAGDWGGIVICGRGIINIPAGTNVVEGGLDVTYAVYGGTAADDNSGHLSYVRIEYAGKFYQANNELNSLTLAGVGSGTVIDHVQCSNGLDDAFEWFGGSVNARNLVAFSGLDDDFDTDFGYSGNVQFAVSLRDPNIADVSGSNGFESDNDATGSTNTPITGAKFSNVTIFGPIQGGGNIINANYKRGAHLRRSTQQDVYNTVILGYPVGLKVENTNTGIGAVAGDLNFENNIIAGCTLPLEAASTDPDFMIDLWFAASNGSTYAIVTDVAYVNPYTLTAPDFRATNGSVVLSGASFTELPSFFEQTTYRGAFNNETPWTNCWTEFDPQNQAYTEAINYLQATISPETQAVVGDILTAEAGAGFTYQWYNDGVIIDGATEQTYTPSTVGAYSCDITSARGCTKSTPVVQVILVGTQDALAALKGKLSVFPNPTQHDFTLSFETLVAQNDAQVAIYDLMGKQVYAKTIRTNTGKNTVPVVGLNLVSGVYFIRITNGTARFEQKLIVR